MLGYRNLFARYMESEASDRVCAVCGQSLGVYEAIVVRTDGLLWHTSLARNPRLAAGDVVMHTDCAATPDDGKSKGRR